MLRWHEPVQGDDTLIRKTNKLPSILHGRSEYPPREGPEREHSCLNLIRVTPHGGSEGLKEHGTSMKYGRSPWVCRIVGETGEVGELGTHQKVEEVYDDKCKEEGHCRMQPVAEEADEHHEKWPPEQVWG